MGEKGGTNGSLRSWGTLVTGVSLLAVDRHAKRAGKAARSQLGLLPLHAAPSPKTQQRSPANPEKNKRKKGNRLIVIKERR